MCDPGWDGDMWNPDTPSGKPVGTAPYSTPDGWKWPTEADRARRNDCSNPTCAKCNCRTLEPCVEGEMSREPNEAEQKFLDAWRKYGLPDSDPEPQWQADCLRSSANRRYVYDFAWPKAKLLIEVQGHGWGHLTPKARARDARKQRVALAAGYIVIPITTDCMSSEDKRRETCEQVICIIAEHERCDHGKEAA